MVQIWSRNTLELRVQGEDLPVEAGEGGHESLLLCPDFEVCVLSLGLRVEGVGFRVWGLGLRVQGSGFRVQGLGFRV